MRRGSLSERPIPCRQPGCGQDPQAGHGPYYRRRHAAQGQTRSRFLAARPAEPAQQHIDAAPQFRAREIETLLGPQSVHDLDFEALEIAARRPALGGLRALCNNG